MGSSLTTLAELTPSLPSFLNASHIASITFWRQKEEGTGMQESIADKAWAAAIEAMDYMSGTVFDPNTQSLISEPVPIQ